MSNRLRAFNYVFAQFALLFVLLLSPRDDTAYSVMDPVLGYLGLVMVFTGIALAMLGFLGLGKSLTASPVPKKNGQLKTTGLYARVRHPIYFGLLLVAIGVVLDAGYWPQLPIAVLLYVLLNSKANWEEEMLKQQYPDYKNYILKTPRFFPRLGR